MTRTQDLLEIVKRNSTQDGQDLRGHLLFLTSSCWKNLDDAPADDPRREMKDIGERLLYAWSDKMGGMIQKIYWVRVNKFGTEEDWTVGDLSNGPFEVQIIGSDDPYELIELGGPVVAG